MNDFAGPDRPVGNRDQPAKPRRASPAAPSGPGRSGSWMSSASVMASRVDGIGKVYDTQGAIVHPRARSVATMLPRRGSTRGDSRRLRGRPHGWNVRTNKDLAPEALCHHQLRKSRGSDSTPCPPGVRHSVAAAAGGASAAHRKNDKRGGRQDVHLPEYRGFGPLQQRYWGTPAT